MTGLKRSSNPFLAGTRPRRYFGEWAALIRSKAMVTDKRKFDPSWNTKAA